MFYDAKLIIIDRLAFQKASLFDIFLSRTFFNLMMALPWTVAVNKPAFPVNTKYLVPVKTIFNQKLGALRSDGPKDA